MFDAARVPGSGHDAAPHPPPGSGTEGRTAPGGADRQAADRPGAFSPRARCISSESTGAPRLRPTPRSTPA